MTSLKLKCDGDDASSDKFKYLDSMLPRKASKDML